MSARPVTPGIRAIRYELAESVQSVRELAAAGQLESDAGLLESFGFAQVHVAVSESPFDLALRASQAVLRDAGVDPDEIGLLLYAGTPSVSFAAAGGHREAAETIGGTSRFKYPATRLQYELGLANAATIALDQLACTSLMSAVRIARALCVSEGIEHVLCASAEFFPGSAGREAIYNCTSDAACALVVSRESARNRVVASAHVTKGYYWDSDAMRNEIVASYFPTARHVMAQAIARAGWQPADVRWVIPHNVSERSWSILLGLAGLPNARLWSGNIARVGHTLAGDNFINLHDAMASGDVQPGDRLLLFAFGYGAHWTALAVEA